MVTCFVRCYNRRALETMELVSDGKDLHLEIIQKAMLFAIDSKLRGCDLVALKVDDVAPHGYTASRATVRQRKTGRPVRFEITEQTRQTVDAYLRRAH